MVPVLLDELSTKLLDCWIFLTLFTILKIWLFNVFSTFYYSNCALKKNMWNAMLIFNTSSFLFLQIWFWYELQYISNILFSKIQPNLNVCCQLHVMLILQFFYLFCKIITGMLKNGKMLSYPWYQANECSESLLVTKFFLYYTDSWLNYLSVYMYTLCIFIRY